MGNRRTGCAISTVASRSGSNRPRKTVEELDEEMNNYFAEAGTEGALANNNASTGLVNEDTEMIL
jgi:hypothetical protein